MTNHSSKRSCQNSSFKDSSDYSSQTRKSIIEKASQEVLYENLGYEEGKVYYFLLTKNEKALNSEFSHSKKYRLLKNLFNLGCMGKIKPEDKEYFNYILLPPPFLYSSSTDKEILLFLENEYLKNHFENLVSEFSQLILKDEKNLIAFLLKYKMKEKAKLITSGFNLSFLGGEEDKVILIKKNESYKMLGVIDT